MRIEVATSSSVSSKDKGDLLEDLSGKVLMQQHYEVTTQVRKTASELDLSARHRVSGRTLYAECKAHRNTLSANVLKNLLGELHFHGYDEAWLITTGPLGKDAKGFVEEWSNKPPEEKKRLSFYTAERIVEIFCGARFIVGQPISQAELVVRSPDSLGEWTLLITEYGIFWAVVVTESGVPAGVLLFHGSDGRLVEDKTLLRRIGGTDSTLINLDLELFSKLADDRSSATKPDRVPKVVQVQSGDDWADYRPARPEHFVGRQEPQDRLLNLLSCIRSRETRTRVFAITGDSGMGKSSLIAKLRDRCANIRNRKKFFLYAVDVRAATDPSYVHASLLAALTEASQSGFGVEVDLKISDYADPMLSPSITAFMRHLEEKQQVVCLVFDQFEELYSKPDLFSVFEEAQRLFLSAVTASTSLALGFAWKTDSTVQQGHPAYFMWHRLADHRFEVALSPFSHSEASTALTLFEKEIGTKVRPELRRQIIENSQGFPWLIKKLCLHLWEQIQQGVSQEELAETLDVASLFDRDIQSLSPPESTCLKAVAKSAPADWYEIIDTYGEEVLRSLQQRRLVVRSGDRLNVYWDIFRDYLVTKSVPALPYTYLPSSPSIGAFLNVATQLHHEDGKSIESLVAEASIKESTAQNVIHDLLMFGVARGSTQELYLDERVDSASPEQVLIRIRDVLRRHALTRRLTSHFDRGETIRQDDMIETLKTINRAAQHRTRTWRLYADRMGRWLISTGLAIGVSGGWQLQDRGNVQLPTRRRKQRGAFTGVAPPLRTIQALEWVREQKTVSRSEIQEAGLRNAFTVLSHFGLVESTSDGTGSSPTKLGSECDAITATWNAAYEDQTLKLVVEYLKVHPSANGAAVASYVNDDSEAKWGDATKMRVGNGLRRWAVWMIRSQDGEIPDPPKDESRKRANRHSSSLGPTLFDEE